MELIVIGAIMVPIILYILLRGAIQEGVFNALVQYDKYKNDEKKLSPDKEDEKDKEDKEDKED